MTTRAHGQTADERREQVLAAAIEEFAEHGFHAARTAAIAARAGISQPYIYALFENKLVLFLAVLDLVSVKIRDAFTVGWRESESGTDSQGTHLRAMDEGYRRLMADENLLRCQLQGYAAASSCPEIRGHMRASYMKNFDTVRSLTGYDEATVARFFATGVLLNIGSALDLPREYVFTSPFS
ncbi:MAG TPA: TetR/AcrR family transcriptional regulator [Trebonia sp.]|jgi:AcrR family transcriptional regulator|nr:TetR/AcrR family transcriptional regulator [Trebonia sp.]